MKKFEIWCEGYRASGDSSDAHKVGEGYGDTFDEAVEDYMRKNPNHGIEPYTRDQFRNDEAYKNRRSRWHIWACALFDNEADARKAFG